MKRPTLSDVAKLADVTPTTVSRVINNRGPISENTKKKVHRAMEELNYQPNALARTLLGKKSQIVGLIFPTTINPFYGEMIFYLEKYFSNKGYRVMICNSMNDSAKERDFVKMLLANQVDGLIVGSHNTDIEIYEKANLPIISIDRVLSDKITVVSSDNYAGGRLATEYLYKRGNRKIAHINSLKADAAPYSYERRLGYLEYVVEKGLPELVFEVDYDLSFEVKVNIISGIIDIHKTIDGLFIADDLTALLAEKVCSMGGKRAIDIVGYDGTEIVGRYNPELATVQQPIKDMAYKAAAALLQQIDGDFSNAGERILCAVSLLEKRL